MLRGTTQGCAAITSQYYPNVQAVSRALFPSNPTHQQTMLEYAISCLQPGIQYFEERYGNDALYPVNVFKLARLFNHTKVHELKPITADIDELSAFPFLTEELDQLKDELPTYVASPAGVDSSMDFLEWWQGNSPDLPHWSSATQLIFLIQPSSAAAERVFSILNQSFDDNQTNSLEDYVEATVMLQYNHPKK